MKIPNMILLRIGLIGLSLMSKIAMAISLSQEYCSSENTGSDYSPEYSIYMSAGKCHDYCAASYAFAVVQYQNCWCSNYIPSDQQSTGVCNQQCPGFPDNQCGNVNSGMYGYIPLYKSPSGTAGAASSSVPQTSSSQPQSIEQPPTSYTPSSSIPITSAPVSSSSETSSSPAPTTPHTTVRVITKSGSVVTQTVTETPIVISGGSGSSSAPEHMQVQQQPLSIGAIAGIVVGSLVGIAAILVAVFLLWRRKRHADLEKSTDSDSTRRPRRNTSVLSKTGLLSRNRPQSMAENNYDDNFYGTGGNSVRHSMMLGAGAAAEGISPVSPLGGSQDNISASARRHSKPLVYDQRLNPSALFANADANGSRVSIQDQNDYSRPLGVTNPDFRASFDSR